MRPAPSTTPQFATGCLAGIRVLDLTAVVLGPVATQILGDHGAEIIKIENPGGDAMRANGASRSKGMSSIFLSINRNKQSLAIDLKTEKGRKIVLELAATADVLVHNMRVPAMERLGLGYEAIKTLNPSIVYCAATGFGQNGPDKFKPALDDIIQAACGIAGLIGRGDGPPAYVPTLIADKLAGICVASAVMAALVYRERTGQGQYVEVPMYETLVEFTLIEHMGGMAFEPPIGPTGYARLLNGGRKPCRTADGYMTMLPYSPKHWADIFAYVGRSDLIAAYDISDRFKINQVVSKLYEQLSVIALLHTREEWIEICRELDIPVTRIYDIDELPEHPHLKAVELFQDMDHPTKGPTRFVRPAAMFERSPMSVRAPAPVLGQHNEAVLASLGYSEDQVAKLVSEGVVIPHHQAKGQLLDTDG